MKIRTSLPSTLKSVSSYSQCMGISSNSATLLMNTPWLIVCTTEAYWDTISWCKNCLRPTKVWRSPKMMKETLLFIICVRIPSAISINWKICGGPWSLTELTRRSKMVKGRLELTFSTKGLKWVIPMTLSLRTCDIYKACRELFMLAMNTMPNFRSWDQALS